MPTPSLPHKPDPIAEIHGLIDRAKRVDDPILVPGDESFDPMARLNLRLAQGHPAANQQPLLSLYDDLSEAQSIPLSEPYTSGEDPMGDLQVLVSGVLPEVDKSPEQVTADPSQAPPQDYSAIESILGREVLELAGSSALSPEARQEALRHVAVALQNPSRDNVRAILLALIRN